MKNITVSDLMTHSPITVTADTNLLECSRLMVKNRIGSLLITEGEDLTGFITRRDILWALVKKPNHDISEIKARDISPKKLITIRPGATIRETIQRMKKFKFERLPVVNNKKLLGVITSRDILSFDPEFYPEFDYLSTIREESRKLESIEKAKETVEGICEECGNQNILYRFNGMLICSDCLDSR